MVNQSLLDGAIPISPSSSDPVGRVYCRKDRVFRAIPGAFASHVQRLLSCGLVAELAGRGIFPNTWICDRDVNGYALLIEHESIGCITYPEEWSRTMLEDAALMLLRINWIANRYGYALKDGHAFNVVFNGLTPVFIDLGSFELAKAGMPWRVFEEFVRCFVYPIKMMQAESAWLASYDSLHLVRDIRHLDYLLWKFPWLQGRPSMLLAFLGKLQKFSHLIRRQLVISRAFESSLFGEAVDRRWSPDAGLIGPDYGLREFIELHRIKRVMVYCENSVDCLEECFEALAANPSSLSVVLAFQQEAGLDRLYKRLRHEGRTGITPVLLRPVVKARPERIGCSSWSQWYQPQHRRLASCLLVITDEMLQSLVAKGQPHLQHLLEVAQHFSTQYLLLSYNVKDGLINHWGQKLVVALGADAGRGFDVIKEIVTKSDQKLVFLSLRQAPAQPAQSAQQAENPPSIARECWADAIADSPISCQ